MFSLWKSDFSLYFHTRYMHLKKCHQQKIQETLEQDLQNHILCGISCKYKYLFLISNTNLHLLRKSLPKRVVLPITLGNIKKYVQNFLLSISRVRVIVKLSSFDHWPFANDTFRDVFLNCTPCSFNTEYNDLLVRLYLDPVSTQTLP